MKFFGGFLSETTTFKYLIMCKILMDEKMAIAKIGSGQICLTVGAYPDTLKNYCLIIHPSKRIAKLGDDMPEYVGIMADSLPSPAIRLDFSSSAAVKVFIKELRKIDRSLREENNS